MISVTTATIKDHVVNFNDKCRDVPADTSWESANMVPRWGVASEMYACSLFSSGCIVDSCHWCRWLWNVQVFRVRKKFVDHSHYVTRL